MIEIEVFNDNYGWEKTMTFSLFYAQIYPLNLNPKLEFLHAVNVNCPQMRLDCLFISRKGRKGELRTITENYPTQNANPQTLPSLGCLRIVLLP